MENGDVGWPTPSWTTTLNEFSLGFSILGDNVIHNGQYPLKRRNYTVNNPAYLQKR